MLQLTSDLVGSIISIEQQQRFALEKREISKSDKNTKSVRTAKE